MLLLLLSCGWQGLLMLRMHHAVHRCCIIVHYSNMNYLCKEMVKTAIILLHRSDSIPSPAYLPLLRISDMYDAVH